MSDRHFVSSKSIASSPRSFAPSTPARPSFQTWRSGAATKHHLTTTTERPRCSNWDRNYHGIRDASNATDVLAEGQRNAVSLAVQATDSWTLWRAPWPAYKAELALRAAPPISALLLCLMAIPHRTALLKALAAIAIFATVPASIGAIGSIFIAGELADYGGWHLPFLIYSFALVLLVLAVMSVPRQARDSSAAAASSLVLIAAISRLQESPRLVSVDFGAVPRPSRDHPHLAAAQRGCGRNGLGGERRGRCATGRWWHR